MRGQKPDLKVVEGGLSKVPVAPRRLAPMAKAEWRKSAGFLIEAGTLAESDLSSLEAYCVAMSMVRQLQDRASKEEPIITSQSGAIKRNPTHSALADYLKIAKQYASELGLTPASRNRKSNRTIGSESDESAPAGLDL